MPRLSRKWYSSLNGSVHISSDAWETWGISRCNSKSSGPFPDGVNDVPSKVSDSHSQFIMKYEIVREARNAALHEGALARHLTVNAVELSLVLEEAIMSRCYRVGDFMVRNPMCAYL